MTGGNEFLFNRGDCGNGSLFCSDEQILLFRRDEQTTAVYKPKMRVRRKMKLVCPQK